MVRQSKDAAGLGPPDRSTSHYPKDPFAPVEVVNPTGLVAGSLARHYNAWCKLPAPGKPLAWFAPEGGVRLPLRAQPPVWRSARQKYLTPPYRRFVEEELARLLAAAAISECDGIPPVLSPLSVVPKKTPGKFRLIVDMRYVNQYIAAPKFLYDDLRTVATLLRTGDWMCSLDLAEGFHHVPVHPVHRPLLAFEWGGRYYQFNVLPFGCSASPWAFTKAVRPVIAYFRAKGYRVSAYMDDLIMIGSSPTECAVLRDKVLKRLRALGWHVSAEKSQLVPTQQLEYLGMLLDTTAAPRFRVPAAKRAATRKEVRRLLSATANDRMVPVRRVARVAGLCLSLARAIFPTRMLLRSVYACIGRRQSWSDSVTLSPEARQDLAWWCECLQTWDGSAMLPTPIDLALETDASDKGWGANLEGTHAAGTWGVELASAHINVREMAAVYNAIRSFEDRIRGRSVLVRSDNTTVVASLNRMVGRSDALHLVTKAVLNRCCELGVTLKAVHLRGQLNTVADALSRTVDNYDWELAPHVFQRLQDRWGPHTIDRFASDLNSHLPRFNSRFLCPGTEHVDAFSTSWAGENNFVNAPFRFLSRVLRHILASGATATVIAPLWPAQPWFPLLLRLAVDTPEWIPNVPASYRRGHSGRVEPLRNPRWRIAAFRVSASPVPRPGHQRLAAFLRGAMRTSNSAGETAG